MLMSGPVAAIDLSNMNVRERVQLNADLLYFEDNQNLDIEAIMARASSGWNLNSEAKTNFGKSPNPFWFKTTFEYLDQAGAPLYLRLNYPHLDQLDIYWVKDGSILREYNLGDTVPFKNRPVEHRIYLLPLDDLHVNDVDLYIKVYSQGPIEMPLDVLTHSKFYDLDKVELIWYGAFFGIMLVMFFYNFFIFILVKDITYFFYLFYVLSTMALQFTLTGASFQFLWPESTDLNNLLILVLTAVMPLAAIAFVRSFLQLETTAKPFDRVLARILLVAFAGVLGASFLLPYILVLTIAHGVSFVAVSFGLYLGISYWIRGVRAARTFALAWFVYLVFILLYLLQITGAIQPSVVSMHALEIGGVLELVLLSLSFGHRINEEKEMRILAQEQALKSQAKLNKNLDQLVRQRTEELEEANRQLKDLSIKDGLTGVYNRRHFDEMIEIEYLRSYREKSWLCIAMLDVDHFKMLNDEYGHQFGDGCLKAIAATAKGIIRRPPDVLARYGGEEFVVLLPGTDLSGGLVVAENIRRTVEGIAMLFEGKPVNLTVSVGVASIIPADRTGWAQLIKQADTHLYQCKEAGRNRVAGG